MFLNPSSTSKHFLQFFFVLKLKKKNIIFKRFITSFIPFKFYGLQITNKQTMILLFGKF